MHEQSRTVKRPDGKWQVVSGVTGEVIIPGPFDSSKDADSAAMKRSDEFGRRVDESMERHRRSEAMLPELLRKAKR